MIAAWANAPRDFAHASTSSVAPLPTLRLLLFQHAAERVFGKPPSQ
jgi:hypothetical protein